MSSPPGAGLGKSGYRRAGGCRTAGLGSASRDSGTARFSGFEERLFFLFGGPGGSRCLRLDRGLGGGYKGARSGQPQEGEMGYRDLPIFAVAELDHNRVGRPLQNLADAPLQPARVTYNVADFDCH